MVGFRGNKEEIENTLLRLLIAAGSRGRSAPHHTIYAFGMCRKPCVMTTASSICVPLNPACTRKLAPTERMTARTTPHTTPTRKMTNAAPHAHPYCGR